MGKIRIYPFERLEIVLLSGSLQFAEYWVFVSKFGEDLGSKGAYEALCDLVCLGVFVVYFKDLLCAAGGVRVDLLGFYRH